METIIRSKGGRNERAVELDSITVPDLWLVAMYLRPSDARFGAGETAADRVLDAWHLTHDLHRHVSDLASRATELGYASVEDALKALRDHEAPTKEDIA